MASVLIVSEKAIAARRIADILSEGTAKPAKRGAVPVYRFSHNGDEYASIGLRGHILKVDFAEEFAKWSRKRLLELVDAPIVKVPSEPEIIAALKAEAKKADRIIIATDFDREGELIGADALAQARPEAPEAEVSRARFSALTEGEVKRAFSELENPYENLAEAGAARQDIDLIWGAVLTRYLSLVAGKRGHDFLSAGRVQTPTLALIVSRELERRAFVPVPYWVIEGRFSSDDERFEAVHTTERFFDRAEAEAVMQRLAGAEGGRVVQVDVTRRNANPPPPLNTTGLMTAAASVGLSPKRTMNAAEGLYMNGFLSYPRTDNTVYPPSLDLRAVTLQLASAQGLAEHARMLLAKERLTASRGSKQTTDHPPIYPTGVPDPAALRNDQRKVWDLVARRFLATLSEPAQIEATKVLIEVAGEAFALSGQRVVRPGWLAVYPYGRQREKEIPALERDRQVGFLGATLLDKETKPPARYSQGALIQEMEKLGLGTKATRHDIIQTLYDRGYVQGDPAVPTVVGECVAKVMTEYGGPISSPSMTAALEEAMDRIVAGDTRRESAVGESRRGLHKVMDGLMDNWDGVRDYLKSCLLKAAFIGRCPACGCDLVVRFSRAGGRFAGCTRYPECTRTFPLPAAGALEPMSEPCPECKGPRVSHLPPRAKEPVVRCIDPACPTNEEPDVDVGRCPACGDRLLLMRSKKTGKRFVRCSRFKAEDGPCPTSFPVPQTGQITPTEETCPSCGSPRIVVETRRGPWEICLDPACETKVARKARRKEGTGRRGSRTAARRAAR